MDPSTRRLEIAVGAAVAEVSVQVAVLIARGTLGVVPLRVVFLTLKVPFCWAALRRRPGGYLAVWLWEIGGVVAALSVHSAAPPRVLGGLASVAVMVLLGRASSAFPTVEFRPR